MAREGCSTKVVQRVNAFELKDALMTGLVLASAVPLCFLATGTTGKAAGTPVKKFGGHAPGASRRAARATQRPPGGEPATTMFNRSPGRTTISVVWIASRPPTSRKLRTGEPPGPRTAT